MNDFFISFTLGFLCTAALFCLCFLVVLGGRVIYLSISRLTPQKSQQPVGRENYKKPQKQSTPVPKAVRSIEIDPSKIDRIYVKKSS